ncbi:MAG: cation transporter [Alistipes sp.]|nr:cation transporter [Alistipes sp.]
MKKILVLCAALLMVTGAAFADEKPRAEKKTVTTVFCTDIDCDHCKAKVMNTIPFEKGIKEVEVDVPTKKITVTYDPSKNSDESLIKAFAKIKVKAEKEE